jgi:hypothetical protein
MSFHAASDRSRRRGAGSAVALALTVLAGTPPTLSAGARSAAAGTSQAEALLAKARTALGGSARISAVRSFVMGGAVSVGHGATKDYGSFKIQCRLPDAFVRYRSVSTLSAGGGASVDGGGTSPYGTGGVGAHAYSFATTLGFEGRRVLYEPHLTTTRNLGPATQADLDALFLRAQREFVRITAGLFAASFAGAPVQFADVPGDVNAVTMTGAGPPLKLTFDPQSHLPVRVDDYVLTHRRDVAGLVVPFRIVLMSGLTVVETWDVREFKIDAPIPPSAFRR